MSGLEYVLLDLIGSCIKVGVLVGVPYLALKHARAPVKPPEALPPAQRDWLPRKRR